MMRTLILIIVFIIVAIGAAIAFTPLGFLMQQSGVRNAGAGWAQVQGTLLDGRISGLHVNGQPVGDVSLKLRPLTVLSLAPEFDVQWGGAGGSGTGILKASKNRLIARDVRLQQTLTSIEGLAPPVRALGGTLRVSNGAFEITPLGCEHASGLVSTDALSLAAEQYGREFGAIEGPLSCSEQDLVLAMNGSSERGDKVDVAARTSFLGAAEFSVVIETQDTGVTLALSQIGFALQDGAWRYRYEQDGALRP